MYSINQVKEEIFRGNEDDEIVSWIINEVPKTFFLSEDNNHVRAFYSKIMDWLIEETQYTDAARRQFASGADGWLIAHAGVFGECLVTNELPDPNSKRKVKIPDVCDQFEVSTTNVFDMLREFKVKFHYEEEDA